MRPDFCDYSSKKRIRVEFWSCFAAKPATGEFRHGAANSLQHQIWISGRGGDEPLSVLEIHRDQLWLSKVALGVADTEQKLQHLASFFT